MTRRPYSFNGDRTTVPDGAGLAGAGTPEGEEPTWHESLLGYCGGDARARDAAEASMREIGRLAGVRLDYGVRTNWQPVDSQRVMLWAARFGEHAFSDRRG